MTDNRTPIDFPALFRRSLLAVAVCAVLVALCYFLVDRPVAFFAQQHDLSRFVVLKWVTYPPPWFETFAPALLALLMIVRAYRPWERSERLLLAACVSLLLTVAFKESLKAAFGRYWPTTWIDDNPSLLGNDAYGFHPFHEGAAYGSFPSGHTARMAAIVAIYWIGSPRWRWLGVLATLVVAAGLIGMDYHFVGDVIAGAFVGGIVGRYVAAFFGIRHDAAVESP